MDKVSPPGEIGKLTEAEWPDWLPHRVHFSAPGTHVHFGPDVQPRSDSENKDVRNAQKIMDAWHGWTFGDYVTVVHDINANPEGDLLVDGGIYSLSEGAEEHAQGKEPRKIGSFGRSFEFGSRAVYNSSLFLLDDYHGAGFASAFYRESENMYRRLGMEKVRLGASNVGAYAWARAGYKFARTMGIADLRKHLPIIREEVANGHIDMGDLIEFEKRLPNTEAARAYPDPDDLPEQFFSDPKQIADYGRDKPWVDGAGRTMWLGKKFLLGNSWQGVKDLWEQKAAQPAISDYDKWCMRKEREGGENMAFYGRDGGMWFEDDIEVKNVKRTWVEAHVRDGEHVEGYWREEPDEYRGMHTAPGRESGAPLHDMTDIFPDDIYGPNGARYYGHGGDAESVAMDRATVALMRSVRGHPDAPVQIYRAVPEHVREIHPGDWVTVNRAYAELHANSNLGGHHDESGEWVPADTRILALTVPARELFTDGNSIHEFGWDPTGKSVKGRIWVEPHVRDGVHVEGYWRDTDKFYELPAPAPEPTSFDDLGDGWIVAADGKTYWGKFGAAGVLLTNTDDEGVTRYFLAHRSAGVDDGDTWGIPGGALNRGDNPLAGALREMLEETSFVPSVGRVDNEYVYQPAHDWFYATYTVAVPDRFDATGESWEGRETGWFTRAEMESMPLHPAFGATFFNDSLTGQKRAWVHPHIRDGIHVEGHWREDSNSEARWIEPGEISGFPGGYLDPEGSVLFWPRFLGKSPFQGQETQPFWKAIMDEDGNEAAFWFVNPEGSPHHTAVSEFMNPVEGFGTFQVSGYGPKTDLGRAGITITNDGVTSVVVPEHVLEKMSEIPRRHRKDIKDAQQILEGQSLKRVWVHPHIRDGIHVEGYWREDSKGGGLVRPEIIEWAEEIRRQPGNGPRATRFLEETGEWEQTTGKDVTPGYRYRFHVKTKYGKQPQIWIRDEEQLNRDEDGVIHLKWIGDEEVVVGPDDIAERWHVQPGYHDALMWQANRAGFDNVEEYEAWTASELKRYSSENDAKVSVRVDADNIPAILKSGRLTTIHDETALAGAGMGGWGGKEDVGRPELSKGRLEFEYNLWNVPPDAPPHERPIYGYIGTPREAVANAQVSAFGNVKLTLKDSVRDRTTITYGDSHGIAGTAGTAFHPVVPSPINDPSPLSISPIYDLLGIDKVIDEGEGEIAPRITKEERKKLHEIAKLVAYSEHANPFEEVTLGVINRRVNRLGDEGLWRVANRARRATQEETEASGHLEYAKQRAQHVVPRIEERAELEGWSRWHHGTFIETQTLGGVKVEDIERIDFPSTPSDEIQGRLDELGIPWNLYGPKIEMHERKTVKRTWVEPHMRDGVHVEGYWRDLMQDSFNNPLVVPTRYAPAIDPVPGPWQVPAKDFHGEFKPEWRDLDYNGEVIQAWRAKGKAWEASIRRALTLGWLSYEEAQERGWHPTGWERRNEYEPLSGLRPIPEVELFHVTTAKDAVEATGLKSRAELEQLSGGHGLGAGDDDTVSFTSDKDVATGIERAVLEAHDVLNGKITPEELVENAKTGSDASRPYWDDYRKHVAYGDAEPPMPHIGTDVDSLGKTMEEWREIHPTARPVDGPNPHLGDGTNYFTRVQYVRDPDEALEGLWRMYRNLVAYRERAGGPLDPLFMGTNARALRDVPRDQIGLLRFRPREGVQGYFASGLSEWRTSTGEAVVLISDEEKSSRVDFKKMFEETIMQASRLPKRKDVAPDFEEVEHPRDRYGRFREKFDAVEWMKNLNVGGLIVGGAVRDELLGRQVKDYDFMVPGLSMDELREKLSKDGRVEDLVVGGRTVGFRAYPRGGPAGGIEVAPPRREVSTGPGRQDFDIVPDPNASIEEDAKRRDFTINALYKRVGPEPVVEPKVYAYDRDDLFHGTRRAADIIRAEGFKPGQEGIVFATTDAEAAQDYAGNHRLGGVLPVRVQLEKPLIQEPGENLNDKLGEMGVVSRLPEHMAGVRMELQAMGYDGVVLKQRDGTDIVQVFTPAGISVRPEPERDFSDMRFGEAIGLDTTTRVFFAYSPGKDGKVQMPIGALTVDERDDTVELVFVQEDYRRRGVASKLLELARETTGLPLKETSIELSPMGRAWAERHGLTPRGIDEYEDPQDVPVLTDREAIAFGSRLMTGLWRGDYQVLPIGKESRPEKPQVVLVAPDISAPDISHAGEPRLAWVYYPNANKVVVSEVAGMAHIDLEEYVDRAWEHSNYPTVLDPHNEDYSLQGTIYIGDVENGPKEGIYYDPQDYNDGRPIPEDVIRALKQTFKLPVISTGVADGEASIIDPLGGVSDIHDRMLRTTSEDSFRDDPLRMMRALRFMSSLDFDLHPSTKKQMFLNADAITEVSGERIGGGIEGAQGELTRMLQGSGVVRALRMARDTEVLQKILPELAPTFDFDQQSDYHTMPVDEHIFRAVDAGRRLGASDEVLVALLLHDSGKPESAWMGDDGKLHYYSNPKLGKDSHEEISVRKAMVALDRLKYPNAFREKVIRLIDGHMFSTHKNPTRAKARRFLSKHGDLTWDLLDHKRADLMAKRPDDIDETVAAELAQIDAFEKMMHEEQNQPLSLADLAINGQDLIDAGFKPGPIFRPLLAHLLNSVLGNPKLNDRDWLMREAQRWMRESQA